jgi:alkanesulfonate monooxygenase SsuD/methylene tetrahydromethanopterin reductase-like flavin-dependent oxidoreductase (luciferase family)
LPIFFSPSRYVEVFGELIGDRDLATFDVAPTVGVILGDDVDACRNMFKPMLALYIGGMGARGRNFYNDLACRYGYDAAAKEIQDLYLDGKKLEAAAAVPDDLVDEVALCGPRERITERIELWKQSPVTTMIAGTVQPEALEVLAELTQ